MHIDTGFSIASSTVNVVLSIKIALFPFASLRVAKLIEAITSVMDNESTALGVLTSLNTTLLEKIIH